ncbi:MAG TPA: NAD(P)-dependent alcohol dehydrogenase, partial [Azospira sp.]|nr:NAD(P)-dependent alcohol dehydrogenase [Azospira sp.]
GGYSEKIVVADKFVLKVPDGLDLAGAAPLLCAGITTWSPLRHWQAGPGSKVAIIGLGGLGHMGLKLAKALGAEVTLFTRSPGKEQDARRLGADHIVLSTDGEQMGVVRGRFDLIIDTVPYLHDLNPYLPTLAVNGTLVLVGYLGGLEPFLNTVPLIMGRKSVAGSLIGGIAETQELLDFCGRHGIVSDVEVIGMQDINAAYERLLQSDVKYRFVIDMASLAAAAEGGAR